MSAHVLPVPNRTVAIAEAAVVLGVSRSTVYNLLKIPGFPRGCKMGRRRVWLVSDLFRFLETHSKGGGR
jgi:predicted DNA-binding transcriptional regulator AlpA